MNMSLLSLPHLYCCFRDFEKAFDKLLYDHCWRHMEDLEVPNEDIPINSCIYEVGYVLLFVNTLKDAQKLRMSWGIEFSHESLENKG